MTEPGNNAIEPASIPGWVRFRVEVVPHDWATEGEGYACGHMPGVDVASELRWYADQAERWGADTPSLKETKS